MRQFAVDFVPVAGAVVGQIAIIVAIDVDLRRLALHLVEDNGDAAGPQLQFAVERLFARYSAPP